MRKFAVLFMVVGASTVGVRGAIVNYSLGGFSTDGSVVSGSFSYDTGTIGANYYSESGLAALSTFTVTISSIPGGGPTSTSFNKSDASSLFVIQTDGAGELVDFYPTFQANAQNYSLEQGGFSTVLLMHPATAPFAADSITWTYTQVPELSHTAWGVGLGLLGFAGMRVWRRR